MFARLLLCLLLQASIIYSIRCVNDNSVIGQNRHQNRLPWHCSHNVFQCLKFECALPGELMVFKGCDTPREPNCESMRKNCLDQGGTSTCYKCNTDLCNGASGLKLFSLIFTVVFTFLTVA